MRRAYIHRLQQVSQEGGKGRGRGGEERERERGGREGERERRNGKLMKERYCKPEKLCVYARFTRRGGLDINPYRANYDVILENTRTSRQ